MKKLIYSTILGLVVASCALITEPNISKEEVYVLAPPHGLETSVATQTLWWEHINGAEKYNVQIVSPSWDSIIYLIADSNISGNKFVVTLPPGEYDWGVRAYNSSSTTPYTISHITIDTTSNLLNYKVSYIEPANNLNTKNKRIKFSWHPLPLNNIDYYTIDIRYNNAQGDYYLPPKNIYDGESIELQLDEGIYAWNILGQNELSKTQLDYRFLVIDSTPPGKPVFVYPPQNNDTLSSSKLYLQWNRPETSLSEITDSLFISTDSLFSPNNYQYFICQEPEYSLEDFSNGHYFARIRSYDAAGNIGEYSTVRKFYIYEK